MINQTEKWKNFFSKNIIKALLFSLVPFLVACLVCGIYGKTILDLSVVASKWNDELFYYKQVEAVLDYGMPQGFYGFDESTAQHLSFAAWSPVLLIPYIVWGFIFGWNFLSPYLCNIFFSMLAIFFFVLLTKPNRKQSISFLILYCCSFFTIRYMLSGMVESMIAFWLILYYSLLINFREKEQTYKIYFLFFIVGILTLIRPYFLIFILAPSYFLFKRNKIWGSIFSLFMASFWFGIYFLISRNLCAPYFVDIINFDWLRQFQAAGIWEGIKYTIKSLLNGVIEYGEFCLNGIIGNRNENALSLQFLIILIVMSVQTVIDFIKKRKKEFGIEAYLTGSYIIIWLAMLLLYQLWAGSRHFVVLITFSVFVISRMEGKWIGRTLITGLLLAVIYLHIPGKIENCDLPFMTDKIEQNYEVLAEQLEQNMILNLENAPNFDNVIIWTVDDIVNEKSVFTKWQMLYAVPKGFGINCCSGGYVQCNLDSLKSRYLAVPLGGNLDMQCKERGKTVVGENDEIIIYDMR